jgi:formylglycine-generating enzyme required for sulfatase activity
MTNQAKPRIFLCHASEDKERVRELYHQLKEAGYHPWLDKYDLLPGQNWRAEIKKILSNPYNLVVVCLSKNSITKRGTVQREIKWALDVLEEMPEGAIYLIPARLEDCQVPEQLEDLHWADLFEPDGFEYLIRSLSLEIGRRQPPTEPEKAGQAADPKITRTQLPPKTTPRAPTGQPFEPEMILIPAGEFPMGSDPGKDKFAQVHEQPQHFLHLPDYYIAKSPVTNAQYLAFSQSTGHSRPKHWEGRDPPKGKEDHPVVHVDLRDAMAYCQWLAKVTGRTYRLPSEAEWEKAARGTDGRIWPWGDEPPDENRCNFGGNVGETTPVGQYSPHGDSPYGCVDMAGNVWEWTLSLWMKDSQGPAFNYPYDQDDGREDLRAGDNAYYYWVVRGGAFVMDEEVIRCASRYGSYPNFRYMDRGFRVVVSPS